MLDLLKQIIDIINDPGRGVILVAILAISVSGMSVYGMIKALKKKG